MTTQKLKDVVAEKIALKIIDGTYPQGAVLPTETELLNEHGVSRTCLREALQVLSGKGLISSKPKRGTIVRPDVDWNFLDAAMLEWRQKVIPADMILAELTAIRAMVEPEAAALSALNASDEQIEEMGRALDDMRVAEGRRTPQTMEADVRFHRLMLAASGNLLLSGLGACVEGALRASIAVTSRPEVEDPIALAQHANVFDAIRDRDPEKARHEAKVLLQMTRELLRKAKAVA
ncbi:FCD domain-containing protein [Stappia sp. GBMRC 2046]|uniref:FCD domain-containing protein n=1 Tax=Stappia sediminis TaxID=2692190 RepID=A0A7X3LVE1_9HYPH|nr:FadR/GntR family transcriptional regulator [Stappia sediminis]MXN65829.1 FCD domain-containing protein [Stappia sediminis]